MYDNVPNSTPPVNIIYYHFYQDIIKRLEIIKHIIYQLIIRLSFSKITIGISDPLDHRPRDQLDCVLTAVGGRMRCDHTTAR
jgi:hypothetical protein